MEPDQGQGSHAEVADEACGASGQLWAPHLAALRIGRSRASVSAALVTSPLSERASQGAGDHIVAYLVQECVTTMAASCVIRTADFFRPPRPRDGEAFSIRQAG